MGIGFLRAGAVGNCEPPKVAVVNNSGPLPEQQSALNHGTYSPANTVKFHPDLPDYLCLLTSPWAESPCVSLTLPLCFSK